MYPEKLETDIDRSYFYDAEFFEGAPFKYIHVYLHKNYKIKMHSHQFYEVNIIMSGAGRHYIDNTSLDVSEGDVFVIPPQFSHGYFSEEKLDIYHVLIKKDFLLRYSEELSELKGFNILFDIEPHLRRLSGKSYNLNVGNDLARLKSELDMIKKTETDGNFVYSNALSLAFICNLCEKISRTVASSHRNDGIIPAMEYIKENIGMRISLDDIAASANMSKSTLNRRFKELLSTSVMNYVLVCRVNKARELLAQKEYSKTEIAQICGFYDVSHMNKYI